MPPPGSAHLHVNVLGWGRLTLLATVVFLGPTVMRTRMEDGAGITTARGLRSAVSGLSVATIALLVTGAGAAVALPARAVAAVGLAVYAAGATAVCLPVWRAGRRARPSPSARFIRAACGWFMGAAWADVVVVAVGSLRLLDALGASVLLGVLAQAILGSLSYLTPMVRGAGPDARAAALRARLDVLPRVRVRVLNLGVALIVAAAAAGMTAGVAGAVTARVGWLLVATVALGQFVLMVTAAGPRSRTGEAP